MRSLLQYGRLPDFEAVLRRFPVAMLAAAILAVYFMWTGFDIVGHRETGLVGGLILAFYTSTLIQLAGESRGRVGIALHGVKLAVAALAVLLCYNWKALSFMVVLAIIAAIVFLGNAAFWRRERDDRAVWIFTQKVWTGAIFATVGSMIFVAGMLAITQALKSLFGLDIEEVVTHGVLPLGLAILAPAYWLGTIPTASGIAATLDQDISFEARALGFLGTWILAPLTLIYGLIVLAYALRILATWELPKGEIAQLVTPFIAIGTFAWLVLEPSVVGRGPLIRLFKRVWFPIALVATVMLLIAVGVRVAEYGLTTERNLLIAFAVAAAILGLWFAAKPSSDIRIPTAAAAGFFLLSAFVARPAGDISQISRLRAALDAPDGSTVFETAGYLVRQNRADWIRDMFPDAPESEFFGAEWQDYLASRGYSPTPDANTYLNARFSTRYPVDLSGMSELVMQGIVNVDVDPRRRRNVDQDRLEYTNGSLALVMDGERHDITDIIDFDDLFTTHALDDTRRVDTRDGGTELPAYDFTFNDGTRGRIVFIELQLNGQGGELGSGYGQVLVFRE